MYILGIWRNTMNLQAIIVTNCIALTILAVLLVSSYRVRQRRRPSDITFTAMILITAAACFFETVSFVVDGMTFPGARLTAVLANTITYGANVITSFLWCLYVDLRLYKKESRLKKHYTWLAVPTAILLAGLLLNMFFGFLFSFDENNVYHRRPLSYVYYITVFFYLGFSVYVRYNYYKGTIRAKFFPIWIFLVPIFVGTALQSVFYGLSLAWCSVAIGLVAIYMSLQNELTYIDPLTGLYNRTYLDHVLEEITHRNSHTGGIMIDIDYFKSINDMYGHAMGDAALIRAARILTEAIPDKSTAVRFAGDEFIVITKADTDQDLLDVMNSIRSCVSSFNAKGIAVYQLSFSMGGSLLNGTMTADEFLNDMDSDMYEEKRRKHCRSTA